MCVPLSARVHPNGEQICLLTCSMLVRQTTLLHAAAVHKDPRDLGERLCGVPPVQSVSFCTCVSLQLPHPFQYSAGLMYVCVDQVEILECMLQS